MNYIIAPYCAQIMLPIQIYYSRGDRASGRDYVRNRLCYDCCLPSDFKKNSGFYQNWVKMA